MMTAVGMKLYYGREENRFLFFEEQTNPATYNCVKYSLEIQYTSSSSNEHNQAWHGMEWTIALNNVY